MLLIHQHVTTSLLRILMCVVFGRVLMALKPMMPVLRHVVTEDEHYLFYTLMVHNKLKTYYILAILAAARVNTCMC